MVFYWPPSNRVAGQSGAMADWDAAYGAGGQIAQALAQGFGSPGLATGPAMDAIRAAIAAGTQFTTLDGTGNVPASELANVPRGLQFWTGGGSLTTTMISNAINAGYQGLELDGRFVWNATVPLVIDNYQNFIIQMSALGSIGWSANVAPPTGYINTGSGPEGIQIYATTSPSTTTQGIIFRNCAFQGTNSYAMIHNGGMARSIRFENCFGYNTGTLTNTIGTGSNGGNLVNIATWGSGFGGNGVLDTGSALTGWATSGYCLVQGTYSNGAPGTAMITYTGISGSSLTGCTLQSNAPPGGFTVSSTGPNNKIAPPQMVLATDTALSGTSSTANNSEDLVLDNFQMASANGSCLGIAVNCPRQAANDSSYFNLTTCTQNGFPAIIAGIGNSAGGHNFWNLYDRSSSGSALVGTVWNNGAILHIDHGEDQNNSSSSVNGVSHIIDSVTAVTTLNGRNLSLPTGGSTASATIIAGTLKATGRCRWSGIINMAANGVLDLSDASCYFNNSSGAGNLIPTGTGTILLPAAYLPNVAGPPVLTSFTGNLVNTSGQKLPRDLNLLFWTADPDLLAGASYTPTAGTIYLMEFWVYQPISTATGATQFAGGTATLTGGCYLGIYTPGSTNFTQIADTADESSSWTGSTGFKTASWLSGPIAINPGRYYAALLLNGSSMPTVRSLTGAILQLSNINLSGQTLRCMLGPTTQTTLPATIAVSSFTTTVCTVAAVVGY